MDSYAAVAVAVPSSPSKENGGGDSNPHLESPPPAEDRYETPSETEDSKEKAAMPIEENKNPNLIENGVSGSQDKVGEVLGGEGSGEVPNSAGEVKGDSKGEGLEGGGEEKVMTLSADEEKDETMGVEDSLEALNSSIEVEGEVKGEESGVVVSQEEDKDKILGGEGLNSSAEVVESNSDENGVIPAQGEKIDEVSVGDASHGMLSSSVKEDLDSKDEENGVVSVQDEKEDEVLSGEVIQEVPNSSNEVEGALKDGANGITTVQYEKRDEVLSVETSQGESKDEENGVVLGEGEKKDEDLVGEVSREALNSSVEVEGELKGVANGVVPAQDEKHNEDLGADVGTEACNSIVEVEQELKPEKDVLEVEENGATFGEVEKKGGDLVANGSEEPADSKPVEVDAEIDERGIPLAGGEKKDESLDGSRELEVVEANPVFEGGAALMAEETMSAAVEETSSDAVEAEKEGKSKDFVELKPAELQFSVADADASSRLDVEEEPKAAEEEAKATEAADKNEETQDAVDFAEAEKVGEAVDADASSLKLDVEEEPKVAEEEAKATEAADQNEETQDDVDVTEAEKVGETVDTGHDRSRELENDDTVLIPVESVTAHEISVEGLSSVSAFIEKAEPDADGSRVADDNKNYINNGAEEEEEGDIVATQQPRVAILDSSETAKQIIKEMEEASSSAGYESPREFYRQLDGQIVSDSDEEVDTDDEGDGKELFDSAALAALLKAATDGASDGNSITITSQDGSRVFSMDRPAGLGSSAPTLRPAPARQTRPTIFSPSELAVTAEPENEMDEEERKLHEKVEDIRVKFLRLVMRLGHTPEETVAAQVLYRLSLAEGIRRGRQVSRAFSTETAKKKAMQLEAEGNVDVNFSCNILVLGKTGVGKSATINSIFGEEKTQTSAFKISTTSVREISGVVDGVMIRIIDTPGLRSSVMEQSTNRRILASIKKYTRKCPPDIVLYVDRLDTQTRDFNDLPLLRSISSALGSSIWFNAIVALTHAGSAPPEGPNGSPLSYEVFIAQRSHVVQHSIRQAAGDMRLMNPVALVENHPSCRRNREGQRVLPNGLSWRPQMLLLCYSSKILSEANSLLKLQDPSPGKLFGFRLRSPPLPYLLSTLLQSRPHPKLPSDQGGENADSDIDLDDFSDADDVEEDEYDQLPPFKPLKKSQLAMLTKEQKRAYFDEYDYRVRLLQKKQWKDELRRLKEMKKRGKVGRDDSPYGEMGEDYDQDGAPAAVPVPLPDMTLPPSFDCDVPTYRYRFLEPTSQLLTRPVLDTHGWDHDCGYDGVSLEETLAIAGRFPAAVAVQITKDKKEFNLHLDSSVSAKHGESGSSLAGFDIQSVGKQLAYILRGETKFKNFKKNKTAAGVSVTFLGETVATGVKVEDQITIGKRVSLVASTGAMRAQGDVAYGANLEARLREKDYPIGQALSTLGLSLMKWRGDLALGANLQSQVNVGRNSKVAVRVGLNNKLSGQITVRTSSSEQLQLALVGIIPVAITLFRSIWPGESDLVH